jgi:hypothetical protein
MGRLFYLTQIFVPPDAVYTREVIITVDRSFQVDPHLQPAVFWAGAVVGSASRPDLCR